LDAGVDVLHHAHGITKEQIKQAKRQGVEIVATPMGGTHLEPNSPENIRQLVRNNIDVSIASDAYLPPYDAWWLDLPEESLQGPDVLMQIAQPSMKALYHDGLDENEILALLTANPAAIMEKEDQFGKIARGMDANFLIKRGASGVEITDIGQISKEYYVEHDGLDENEILALLTANPEENKEKEEKFGKIARGMDANFLITSGVSGLEITDIGQISKVYFRGEEVVDRVK